jgi:hypothetical protein
MRESAQSLQTAPADAAASLADAAATTAEVAAGGCCNHHHHQQQQQQQLSVGSVADTASAAGKDVLRAVLAAVLQQDATHVNHYQLTVPVSCAAAQQQAARRHALWSATHISARNSCSLASAGRDRGHPAQDQ